MVTVRDVRYFIVPNTSNQQHISSHFTEFVSGSLCVGGCSESTSDATRAASVAEGLSEADRFNVQHHIVTDLLQKWSILKTKVRLSFS